MKSISRTNIEDPTILLTTHYLDEADALCDRIFIIDHGKIVASRPRALPLMRRLAAKQRVMRVTIDDSYHAYLRALRSAGRAAGTTAAACPRVPPARSPCCATR